MSNIKETDEEWPESLIAAIRKAVGDSVHVDMKEKFEGAMDNLHQALVISSAIRQGYMVREGGQIHLTPKALEGIKRWNL